MVDLRTVMAAVLGVGLGLVLLVYPAAVIRVQTVGRLPHDRGGEYGQDSDPPRSWLVLVRLIGVGLVLVGGYFAWTAFGATGPA